MTNCHVTGTLRHPDATEPGSIRGQAARLLVRIVKSSTRSLDPQVATDDAAGLLAGERTAG